MKNSIFISYRRADLTKQEANLLHESLENTFGKDTVFLDDADLHGGDKWRQVLNDAGTNAKICLVVIGPNWMGKNPDGTMRIQNPKDVVRQEIEYAIDRKLVLIPVLVHDASLPKEAELPPSLQSIPANQSNVLNFKDWKTYKLGLIDDIKRHYAPNPVPKPTPKKYTVWYILSGLGVLGLFMIWSALNKSGVPMNKGVVNNIHDSDPGKINECVQFSKGEAALKTIFFPVISSVNNKLEYDMEDQFTTICKSYQVDNENKVSEYHRQYAPTSSDLKPTALKCKADMYFSGKYDEVNGKANFRANLGLVHDSINLINTSEKEFKLYVSNTTLDQLIGGQVLDSIYHRILKSLLGFALYQKKNYEQSIQVFKEMEPEKIANDSFRNIVYRVMADASYQANKKDSALMYLEKTKPFKFSTDLELKKSILATETKQPDKAIQSYTKLLDSSKLDKNILYEKRADQYREIKDLKRAREDYKNVKPTPDPVQTKRIQTKTQEVDAKILSNTRAIEKAKVSNITPSAKLDISDRLLQNGDVKAANEMLKTIPANTIEFQKAAPLLIESEVKMNKVDVNTVSPTILQNNARLRTAVKMKQ